MVTKVDHKNLTSETAEKLMNKNPNRIPVLITHSLRSKRFSKTNNEIILVHFINL